MMGETGLSWGSSCQLGCIISANVFRSPPFCPWGWELGWNTAYLHEKLGKVYVTGGGGPENSLTIVNKGNSLCIEACVYVVYSKRPLLSQVIWIPNPFCHRNGVTHDHRFHVPLITLLYYSILVHYFWATLSRKCDKGSKLQVIRHESGSRPTLRKREPLLASWMWLPSPGPGTGHPLFATPQTHGLSKGVRGHEHRHREVRSLGKGQRPSVFSTRARAWTPVCLCVSKLTNSVHLKWANFPLGFYLFLLSWHNFLNTRLGASNTTGHKCHCCISDTFCLVGKVDVITKNYVNGNYGHRGRVGYSEHERDYFHFDGLWGCHRSSTQAETGRVSGHAGGTESRGTRREGMSKGPEAQKSLCISENGDSWRAEGQGRVCENRRPDKASPERAEELYIRK